MTGEAPDPQNVHSPLTKLVSSRMREEGWKIDERTRPTLTGGPSRSTLNRYMQPGLWLRSGLLPQTVAELAAALQLQESDVREAGYASIDPARAAAVEAAKVLQLADEVTRSDEPDGRPVGAGLDAEAADFNDDELERVRSYMRFIRGERSK